MPRTKFKKIKVRKGYFVQEIIPSGKKIYITTRKGIVRQKTSTLPRGYNLRSYIQRGNVVKLTLDEIKKKKM